MHLEKRAPVRRACARIVSYHKIDCGTGRFVHMRVLD
jgi:hypothetical protein